MKNETNEIPNYFHFKEKKYFSYLDEKYFYEWLESIDDVVEVEGEVEGLRVTLRNPSLSRSCAYDLVALFSRYGYDLSVLRKFISPDDEAWFYRPDAYWFSSLYGEGAGKNETSTK